MERRSVPGGHHPEHEADPSPPLPADHVLSSGAVLFPGAYDQHGCPLFVFPVDGQTKLTSELSKAHVVDFITYFHRLHIKKQEKHSLLSVVADLRQASPQTIRFIAETLLLLELHRRTVHSVYLVQPVKKDSARLLHKALSPAKPYSTAFKKVLVKEVPELSNYIDRSQLPPSLGGYLVYCHHSWVAFVKDIELFVQHFQAVVQRLPASISTLQALTHTPLPSTFSQLTHFCSTSEVHFLQLRRELGLDELLRHCEKILDKLRYPEKEACYQAMAGTALFTHTAFDMLHNHSRITAAVEKVELLWQQASAKARLQLQVWHLRDNAMQITENIESLLQEKLQPYKIQIARDGTQAGVLASAFEASTYLPAMELICCAEDVTHTMADILSVDRHTKETWVVNLQRLKDKLHSIVTFILQTLKAVTSYHQLYNKASTWYSLVLHENFLQELLSGIHGEAAVAAQRGTVPAWRLRCTSFLKRNPPPFMEELIHLDRVSELIPDEDMKAAANQMSQRCMTLRTLLISSGPVVVGHLQKALQWQYELLLCKHTGPPPTPPLSVQPRPSGSRVSEGQQVKEAAARPFRLSPPKAGSELALAEPRPCLGGSCDSGSCGGLSSQGTKEQASSPRDLVRPALSPHRVREQRVVCASDSEEHCEDLDLGSAGNSSRGRLQLRPKVRLDSLNLEIKVKRSVAPPTNPWLSLPVDDLENSYTVTITHNPTHLKGDSPVLDPAGPRAAEDHVGTSRNQRTQTEALSSTRQPDHGGWSPLGDEDDADQSHVSKILSSTISDGGEASTFSVEGRPTLLWDSYDLHEQNSKAADGTRDLSLTDWDVKEQAGLREVERMLSRTSDILEEEEKVLSQEVVLDVLLESERRQDTWSPWNHEDQSMVMSSSELAEAGVLTLDDGLGPGEPDSSEDCSNYSSGVEALEKVGVGAEKIFNSRPELLTELQKVHLLDELIMEEPFKIQQLRCSEENLAGKLQASLHPEDVLDVESPRLDLEKKEEEVEQMKPHLKLKDSEGPAEGALMKEEQQENMLDGTVGSSRVQCKRSEVTHEPQTGTRSTSPPSDRDSPSLTSSQIRSSSGSEVGEHASGQEDHALFESRSFVSELDKSQHPHQSLRDVGQSSPNMSWDVTDGVQPPDSPSSISKLRSEEEAFDPGGAVLLPPPSAKPRKSVHSASASPAPLLSSLSNSESRVLEAEQSEPLEPLPDHRRSEFSLLPVEGPGAKADCNSNNNNNSPPETSDLEAFKLEEVDAEEEAPCWIPEPPRASSPAELLHQRPSAESHPLEFDPGGGGHAVRTPHRASPALLHHSSGSTRELEEFKTPLVLDTGSGFIKAGFADQDLPSVVFPTIVGFPKYEEVMNVRWERELYLGHDAQHMRGVLTLTHPVQNGIVRNWDEMEKIWEHTFQQLNVDPEDHPVLLTEAAMNPLENRQHMVQIMFETFSVPFTFVAMQAVLALYAAGRTTGVVLDSGDGVTHSVPVFEGYSLPHAVQRFPLAGVDVTRHLKQLLQEQGVSMRTTAEEEIVREMKEKCCYVASDQQEALRGGLDSNREMNYTLPDGQTVTLGSERLRAPEILFQPHLIGRDHVGLHESVFKSIQSADIDLRRSFLKNLVLSGGNTLLSGLPERLQAEIRGLLPVGGAPAVHVSSPAHRDFSVWRGGTVLANVSCFSSAWISQEEYEEHGPQVVIRKCF